VQQERGGYDEESVVGREYPKATRETEGRVRVRWALMLALSCRNSRDSAMTTTRKGSGMSATRTAETDEESVVGREYPKATRETEGRV
jgi:hypothetical protein